MVEKLSKFEEFVYKQDEVIFLFAFMVIICLTLSLFSEGYIVIVSVFLMGVLLIWITFISYYSSKKKLFERKLELGEYY